MNLQEPISFGRYFLIDKVAVGGMAEVFKAKSFSHGGFEKLLVIKRILQHLSDNDEFVEMFIDEAKISVELQHPNIVQIYDFGRIAENYFIAMECVEGKDVKGILRKLAERRVMLPMEYAVYIAHEMCKGLDFAHKRTDMQETLSASSIEMYRPPTSWCPTRRSEGRGLWHREGSDQRLQHEGRRTEG